MSGLNLGALKALQENLGNGDDLYLYENKIPAEMEIRLLPPPPAMNGIYFHEERGFWINKKFYVCPATFGLESVLQQEHEAAKERAKTDKQLEALLKDWTKFKPETRYKLPFLHLSVKFDDRFVATEIKVINEKARILICKAECLKKINLQVTARANQNGTDFGIMDRVLGYNLTMGKTGEKLTTEYTAMAWKQPTELPEKYYASSFIPDVVEGSKKMLKSDRYLRGIIRNFFYGEALPAEDVAGEVVTPAVVNTAAPAKEVAAPVVETVKVVVETQEPAKVLETPAKEVIATPKNGGNLLANLASLNDD